MYRNADWAPQIIIIGLGDNDFSTPLLPSEKWPTHDALIEDSIASYIQLITGLHSTSPKAELILIPVDAVILTDAEQAKLTAVMETVLPAAATDAGFEISSFVSLASFASERTACDFHASKADQQRRADWLAQYIAERPQLWQ